MDNTILLALIGIFEMVLTSLVTFLFTRRKYKNEVKEGEIHNDGYKIDNDEKKFNLYIKMINENEKRIDRLQKENDNLSLQIAEMRSVVFGMLQ
jgi:cell division protein YceG involved in septum cleavage